MFLLRAVLNTRKECESKRAYVVVCPLQPSSSVNSGCPGPESLSHKFTGDRSLG